MPPLRLAFLGSSRGTTFKALLPMLRAKPQLAVSLALANKPCGFLDHAKSEGLDAFLLKSHGESRAQFEIKLISELQNYNIDLVILCGFMRILSPLYTKKWGPKTLNVHPSLLPKHKGLMDLAVHQAVIDNQETQSGVSVHLVNEEVDGGKVLLQQSCPVLKTDCAESLRKRVQALEADALTKAILNFIKIPCEEHHD